MPTTLITGANRGIGLELTRQFGEAGWRVIACCRNPEQAHDLKALTTKLPSVQAFRLDVSDPDQISGLSASLENEAIDILLNNAGVYGAKASSFGSVTMEEWLPVLEVNTIAPLLMAQCFVDQVSRSDLKTVATLSSKVGSIEDNRSGSGYAYRSSKTAVNQVMKSLSIDLASRGIKAVALHPGWVKTDMGGPNALIDTKESARRLIVILTGLTTEQSGSFINYDGSVIPW